MNTQRITFADVGIFIIRVAVAIVFLYHGSQKLFGLFGGPGLKGFAGFLNTQLHVPSPMLSAALAACAEFFGGLFVLLGVGLRLAVIPMAFTMLIAVVKVHNKAFSLQNHGMEYALTLLLVLIGLELLGPGRLTLSRFRSRPSTENPGAPPAVDLS